MTVSQSQTSALCNCRNTEVCCPTGKSPYAGGMRKAVLPELGSSYHSIFYGFTLMMFCSVLSGKYYMLETIPVVGSGAQTWGVPVWSGPVLAAHLSSCFPPLVKEIKCCAYLCRRVSFSGWEVSETIYPTDFYREKQTADKTGLHTWLSLHTPATESNTVTVHWRHLLRVIHWEWNADYSQFLEPLHITVTSICLVFFTLEKMMKRFIK